MKTLLLIIFLLLPFQSHAAYDASKLSDWKWHAYICKNVVIHLSMIAEMQQKFGADEIDTRKEWYKKKISEIVLKQEKSKSLDKADSDMIAHIVFSIRKGFQTGKIPLNSKTAIYHGFDICVNILEQTDQELLDSK